MAQHVFIVGLGLIGASMALCIRQTNPELIVVGWDSQSKTREQAVEQQIVDYVANDFETGAEQADVILLAVPVRTTLAYLDVLERINLSDHVIITDVSSTKQQVVTSAEQKNLRFVGGHPMAGSHKSGIQAADAKLFENAYYIFTPLEKTKKDVEKLQELFCGTKAKYVTLTAGEHDRITGMLSHFPHILAAGLVNQAEQFNQEYPRAKQLAAGGFRDITRIASSDPVMWTDILLSNKQILLERLADWQQEITQIAEWIMTENQSEIFSFFNRAKESRDQLPVHKQGAIPAFFDLFIDVPDETGVIAEVTGLIGKAGVSLINLKIQETREDILGILQISFKNQQDLLQAKRTIISNTSYHCWIK
ncbi:prephenate dehydrogenase [Enterococcus faecium]|nr:prephenate dehydrogenase [Enterococcus faecium]